MQLWGIDLGGTKIEGVIINLDEPNKDLLRLRLPTNASLGYEQIIQQVARLIEQLEKTSGLQRPKKIGFGTPGVTEASSGVFKNSNTLCLNGRSLHKDLAKALGVEVVIANDANCFTLAETTLGVARGYNVVIGLILGTGVGGGVVVNGHIIEGLHGIAGEWGHNRLCEEEGLCYCGKKGCNEEVISGPALQKFYHEKTGKFLVLPEIVQAASAGDEAAMATLKRLQEKFAEAIAVLINILDPHAIVIGGGVGNIDLLYSEETRALIAKHVFNDTFKTPLLKPQLGDSAGVFGAAMLTKVTVQPMPST
ncbi:MAG: ROK family protein [Chthoniobacterales bacterium]